MYSWCISYKYIIYFLRPFKLPLEPPTLTHPPPKFPYFVVGECQVFYKSEIKLNSLYQYLIHCSVYLRFTFKETLKV